jgi:glutathione S-transferase
MSPLADGPGLRSDDGAPLTWRPAVPDLTLVIGTQNVSSWSLRPWLALKQTGAAFKTEKITLRQPDTRQQILRHSPAGHVPILKDGERLIWDSIAILEYLAERFPAAQLWPQNTVARAVARSVSAEVHAGFAALRDDLSMDIRLQTVRQPNVAAAADIERITAIWRDCREHYGAGGDFLFGRFSNADAMYAPVVTRFKSYGVPLDPVSAAYRDAVLALPAMREWYAAAAAEA